MNNRIAQLIAKRTDYQPQHVLHLLLSLLTLGLWLPVWALVGISHRNERAKIDARIEGIIKGEEQ